MRSSDLAKRAGVTVRALRHYHQVGVLAEPARGANGYRRYSVHDLIRLLRIKRLASLGIPLEKMPEILDGQPGDHVPLLDDLESEIDTQIARLQAQKVLLDDVRNHNAGPDFPPELARFSELFMLAGASSELSRMDRDQAILLAHLADGEDVERLVGAYELMAAPALREAAEQLAREFDRLDNDAGDAAIEAIVDHIVDAVGPLMHQLDAGFDGALNESATSELFLEYQRVELNAAQRRVMAEITQRFSDTTEIDDGTSERTPPN